MNGATPSILEIAGLGGVASATAWTGFALAALLVIAAGARTAFAGTEEFSTFDVLTQEEDDESMLDHFMTRPPRAWRDEWERAPQAIRTAQGCLTSGQWFIDTDLKLRSSLGKRGRFGLDLKQSESDAATYDYLDFSFKLATRKHGTVGLMFRPLYDKSRQDFAATWEAGSDTSSLQLQVVFTLEDMFNNLWAWRQTRVGLDSEPYNRHPYEPAFHFVSRHARWRAEAGGRYLTPSVKRRIRVGAVERVTSLWGSLGYLGLEASALGITWEARGTNQQALSTDQPLDYSTGRHKSFRRSWSTETAARRRFGSRVGAEVHWLYRERDQNLGPPLGLSAFRSIDRLLAAAVAWKWRPALTVRSGLLYDRISVRQHGTPQFTYGSRRETRGFVGLEARMGRVTMSVVEGLELDHEPYDVWGVHDKGFFQLQTTF